MERCREQMFSAARYFIYPIISIGYDFASDVLRCSGGLPQREALAECRDGAALDGGGDARSRQGFRWLKAHKQLPVLRAALLAIQAQQDRDSVVVPEAVAA